MTDLAIELNGVGKSYRFFSLDHINLEVPEGEIMGLIGPNGAGKSTTIRILMGLVHQDSGDVRVLGHRMPAAQVAAKWDIGFASEDMRLYDGMTLAWHMASRSQRPMRSCPALRMPTKTRARAFSALRP
jgi:ABC-2 type transport system ATP-binding protein